MVRISQAHHSSASWCVERRTTPEEMDPTARPPCAQSFLLLLYLAHALTMMRACSEIPSANSVVWDEEGKLCAIALPSSTRVFTFT